MFAQAAEFDKLTDAEIDALPELPLVIARCAPETKGEPSSINCVGS